MFGLFVVYLLINTFFMSFTYVSPYNTPRPAAIPAGTGVPSAFATKMNQICGCIFQLGGTPFASTAAMKLQANWDALFAAADATKIVATPPVSNSKVTASKKLETAPDSNATYRGQPIYMGEGVAMFSAEFLNQDFTSIASLDALLQFSLLNSINSTGLVVYLITTDGAIISTTDNGGIFAINFSKRTRSSDGLNASDIVGFDFYLQNNWDLNAQVVIPSFDPRLYFSPF